MNPPSGLCGRVFTATTSDARYQSPSPARIQLGFAMGGFCPAGRRSVTPQGRATRGASRCAAEMACPEDPVAARVAPVSGSTSGPDEAGLRALVVQAGEDDGVGAHDGAVAEVEGRV